jgi:hypothetical protein
MWPIKVAVLLVLSACTNSADNVSPVARPEYKEEHGAIIGGGETNDAAPTGKALLAELAAFDDSHYIPHVFRSLISRIFHDPSIPEDVKIDHLLLYAEKHRHAGSTILAILTGEHNSKLGPWLLKHGAKLQEEDWRAITEVLSIQMIERNTWQDREVIAAFVKYCLPSKDDGIYFEGVRGIAFAGDVQDVIALIPKLDTDIGGSRRFVFDAQTRFDQPQTNAVIRKLFADYKEPNIMEILLAGDLIRNNRYDFIPDLKRLRARLTKVVDVAQLRARSTKITDITEKSQALGIIEAIDEAIPKLEKIKASGVTVGEHIEAPEQ